MNESTALSIITWLGDHPVLSGFVIFFIALTESLAIVGLLVPGVVLMLIIGAYLATGQFSLFTAIILTFAGAVAGDGISYYLGYHYKNKLITLWPLSRYPDSFQNGVKFFKRHGSKSIFFGRFVGPIRPLIPAIAGMFQMPQKQFFFSNVLSALVWAPVVLLPGYAIGLSLELAGDIASRLIILIILFIGMVWLVFWILKTIYLFLMSCFKNDKLKTILNISLVFFIFIIFLVLNPITINSSKPEILIIEKTIWKEHMWNTLVTHRKGFMNKIKEPFNVQLIASKKEVIKKINANSDKLKWKISNTPEISEILQYLNPQSDITALALFPHLHNGTYDQLRLTKRYNNELHVIRLWKTNYKITEFYPEQNAKQLWQGTLTKLTIVKRFGIKTFQSELIDDIQLSEFTATFDFIKNNKKNNLNVLLLALH